MIIHEWINHLILFMNSQTTAKNGHNEEHVKKKQTVKSIC